MPTNKLLDDCAAAKEQRVLEDYILECQTGRRAAIVDWDEYEAVQGHGYDSFSVVQLPLFVGEMVP
jgi:hypothetical protein